MRKYDNYKDSGIEWIGEIPEHWDSVSLKWIASIYSGGTPSKNKPEYWNDGTIPWLNSGEVNQGDIREASEYITEEALSDSSAKWIPEKSLVMALAGQGKTKGMVAQVQFRTTCNQSLGVIVPNKKIDNRFLMYWLRKNYQNIRNLGGGDKRDGINLEMIGSIKTPITTPEEQTAIANYLDRKTAEIDELIADKKRLLELYEEEKTAIINQAVTKGINPNVPMKDSGIEWLGEIPEHWEVRKANSLISVKRGAGYQYITEVYGDEEFEYVLRISDFNNYDPIRALKTEELGKYRVATGEILIAGTGASAGITMYVDEKMDGLVHSYNALRISVSKPFVLFNKYLFFLFQSHMLNEQMSLAFTGSAQHFLDVGRITSFLITLPDFQEQQTIVHHIETECARIDAKKAKTEKLIELLTEYRTALISEVVTGKIKVI